MIGLVSGTEDGALLSDDALDFWGHVAMLLGESLRLFSSRLIFTVIKLKHYRIEKIFLSENIPFLFPDNII
jgi:hypothetical protein